MLIEQYLQSAYSQKKDELAKAFKARRKRIKKVLNVNKTERESFEDKFAYQSQFSLKFLLEYIDTHNFRVWNERCNKQLGKKDDTDICHFLA